MLHLVVTSVHCLSFQVEQRDFFGLFFSLCTGPIHDRQPLTLRRDNKLIIWRMPCSQGAALRLFRRRRFFTSELSVSVRPPNEINPSFTYVLVSTHSQRATPPVFAQYSRWFIFCSLFVVCTHLSPFTQSIHNLWGENVKRELLGYSMQIAAVNE